VPNTALVGVALCLGLLPMAAPALGAGDYIVVLKDFDRAIRQPRPGDRPATRRGRHASPSL